MPALLQIARLVDDQYSLGITEVVADELTDIGWRTPDNPRRVGVVVARVPAAEVADLYTASSWLDDGSSVDTNT